MQIANPLFKSRGLQIPSNCMTKNRDKIAPAAVP